MSLSSAPEPAPQANPEVKAEQTPEVLAVPESSILDVILPNDKVAKRLEAKFNDPKITEQEEAGLQAIYKEWDEIYKNSVLSPEAQSQAILNFKAQNQAVLFTPEEITQITEQADEKLNLWDGTPLLETPAFVNPESAPAQEPASAEASVAEPEFEELKLNLNENGMILEEDGTERPPNAGDLPTSEDQLSSKFDEANALLRAGSIIEAVSLFMEAMGDWLSGKKDHYYEEFFGKVEDENPGEPVKVNKKKVEKEPALESAGGKLFEVMNNKLSKLRYKTIEEAKTEPNPAKRLVAVAILGVVQNIDVSNPTSKRNHCSGWIDEMFKLAGLKSRYGVDQAYVNPNSETYRGWKKSHTKDSLEDIGGLQVGDACIYRNGSRNHDVIICEVLGNGSYLCASQKTAKGETGTRALDIRVLSYADVLTVTRVGWNAGAGVNS